MGSTARRKATRAELVAAVRQLRSIIRAYGPCPDECVSDVCRRMRRALRQTEGMRL